MIFTPPQIGTTTLKVGKSDAAFTGALDGAVCSSLEIALLTSVCQDVGATRTLERGLFCILSLGVFKLHVDSRFHYLKDE